MIRLLVCIITICFLFNVSYAEKNLDDEILTKAVKKFYIPAPKGKERIEPKKTVKSKPSFSNTMLIKYKPKKVLSSFPKNFHGEKIDLVPVGIASFLPLNEYFVKWGKNSKQKFIFLGAGVYSLDMIWNKLKGKDVISKKGNIFTLHAPIFISKDSTLVIKNQELRLNVDKAPVIVNGKLYIGNSKIIAWDTKKNKYAEQHKYSKEDFYLYGKVSPRPYIIGIRDGKLIFVNSLIKGLGYRGLFGSFGVGLSTWTTKQIKFGLLNKLLGSSCSSGIFIGNEFADNYMGFYSNEACNVVFIGNYVHDSLQYGFDPHDWSKNMIVAYNYFKKTKKAHGIVFSRFVNGTIFGNILENNYGAGIMLDRCSNAFISDNLLFANTLGGISIIESDENYIENNVLARNNSYGIYVRNSLNTYVNGNKLIRNIGAGIDVANADITYQVYRNLFLDKYHEASSAWIENNDFYYNLACDVKSTNGGAIALYKNNFLSNSNILCKSIRRYLYDVITFQNKKPIIIKGYGNKKLVGYEDLDTVPVIENILFDLAKEKSVNSRTALGVIELGLPDKNKKDGLNWLISSASQGDVFGFLHLGINLFMSKNPLKRQEGLILLSQAAISGNKNAQYVLYMIPFMTKLSETDVENAIDTAGRRLKSGVFINCDIFEDKTFCCNKNYDTVKLLKKKTKIFFKTYALSGASSYKDFIYNNIIDLINEDLNQKISAIEEIFKHKNKDKLKYFNWLKKQKKKIKSQINLRNYEVTKFFYKKKGIKKSWERLVKISGEEDFKYIESDLRRLLKEMNSFRIKKVNIEKTINVSRRKYFAN